MSRIKYLLITFLFLVAFAPSRLYPIDFTGFIDNDFEDEACITDARSIAMPPSFSDSTISGFDAERICIIYDELSDTLYVGIGTFENLSTGSYIPFGDADGDGNPGSTSGELLVEGGEDLAHLADEEYFSFIIDFDADFNTVPNVIAGTSVENSLPNGFRVSEIALPHLGLNFSSLDVYYGSVILSSNGSEVYVSPSSAAPHLEFLITNFSNLPGFSDMDLNDPNEEIGFIFKAGSFADTGIGDEDVQIILEINRFFDVDSDTVPNAYDEDQDNDGIPDISEMDLDGFDTDNDCIISADEATASGLDTDGDGDIDSADGWFAPDTDGDGIADYLDSDSDNDSINDMTEANANQFDQNNNALIDPNEFDVIDDGTNYLNGDGNGCLKNSELPDSDNDGIPNYRDDGVSGAVGAEDEEANSAPARTEDTEYDDSQIEIQGSGLGSCQLMKDEKFNMILIWFMLISLIILFRKKHKSVLIIAVLLFATNSYALNVELLRPNFDHLGLFNLLESRNLEKNAWSVGMTLGYSHHPVEVGLRSNGARVDSLVDYQVLAQMSAAYGITDWVEVGVIIPFFPAMDIEPLGTANQRTTASFGDVGIAAKFHVWDIALREDNVHMGFAISPFINFPSGDESKYTGDTNVTGGLDFIYDTDLWKNVIVLNLGFRFREKESLLNLVIGQELLYGLGFRRPIVEKHDFHGITEIKGSTAFNGFGKYENRSPLEWLLGFRKGFMDSQLNTTVGVGMGFTTGYGTPDFRVFGMISYLAKPIEIKKKPKDIGNREPYNSYVRLDSGQIVIIEPIHFETAKWNILPESLPVVMAVADLMKAKTSIRHIVVEGHTDNRGSDKYNIDLSDKRSKAVVAKLIEYNVEPERLSNKGWGEMQPIVRNKTSTAMSKNRRVEFHIVEVDVK